MTTFWVIALLVWGVAIAVITSKHSEKKRIKAEGEKLTGNINAISFISNTLEASGYKITRHGIEVALMLLVSNYSKEETFAYISMISAAQHAQDAGDNAVELMSVASRGATLANVISDLYKNGGIREALYNNDINALSSVISIDENQKKWIDEILTKDPAANSYRVSTPVAT
ncbi:hypothetical protein ACUNEV_00655 [Serratia sp. IR-2025]